MILKVNYQLDKELPGLFPSCRSITGEGSELKTMLLFGFTEKYRNELNKKVGRQRLEA